jgi:hypothetical protein
MILQTCLPYWPDHVNSKQVHRQVAVELMAVNADHVTDHVVVRDLQISEVNDKVCNKANTMPHMSEGPECIIQ